MVSTRCPSRRPTGTPLFVFCLSLLLVDIAQADSLNVRRTGSCPTPGRAWGVAVSGSYAYVADEDSGLRVISVSDPAHPTEVGHCGTLGVRPKSLDKRPVLC